MKHSIIILVLPVFLLFSCSKQQKEVKLEEGTPGYQLARDLSAILPMLDPDVNTVLVSTNTFNVTTGEIIQTLYSRMGKRTDQLKTFNAERLRSIFDENASRIAERNLLLDSAKKAKSSFTPEEFNNVLNLQYSRSGGEEKFLQALQENGIDIDFVKKNIEEELLIQNYLEDYFTRNISISEEDVQKNYLEDKTASVRHILMRTEGKDDEEKEEIHKKMEDVLARAKNGEDFAELAKTYSEDSGSKDNGGLYENFGRGQMVKPFEDAAFSVPVGEISDIVETSYGYHIIQVINRTKETRPLDEVRSEIEGRLRQMKQNDVFNEHIGQLKKDASFKILDY